ncbi:MAG: PaaI family thioesterase [Acidimicrobiia bacterium]
MTDRQHTVQDLFDRDPYAASQGFELLAVTDDEVIVSTTVRDDQINFHGGTHGGVLFSLADCAFSLASNAYGDPAVAIDTHLAITAPSQIGDVLTATAREMTRGRSLATYRVDVTRPDGRTVALFTGTVFITADNR